jgi:uncharacterized membrane protein YcaP (DUF421 family)
MISKFPKKVSFIIRPFSTALLFTLPKLSSCTSPINKKSEFLFIISPFQVFAVIYRIYRPMQGKTVTVIFLIATIIRTFIIYCAVGICMRLMGKKQLGQLQPGELIITILISEVVATPIVDASAPLLSGILPLLLLASFEILSSVLAAKSVRFRYLSDGKPVTVIKDGVLQQKALKALRFTVDDILAALRQKDIFSIDDVEFAVAETNGTLSVLPKAPKRALTPEAMEGKQKNAGAATTVVVDGVILESAIKETSVTLEDIKRKIKRENVDVREILLMTVDKNKEYTVILKRTF